MVRCSAYGIIYVFERLKEPGAWRIAPGLAKFHSSPMMKVAKTLQTQIVWLHCLNMFEYLCSYFETPHSIGSCSHSNVSASEVELTGTGHNQIQFNLIQ